MTERRFNQTEVSEIFERAAASDGHPRDMQSTEGGMTLSDLHEIGREVGLAPHAIADAVAALDAAAQAKTRGFLGLPLRVEHVLQLPRPLSDADWERTVVALREIFDARGVVKSDGSLRQWTNGNLQVFLEPSGPSQRLRFRTVKGNAPPLMALGLGGAGAAGAALIAQLLAGGASVSVLAGLSLMAIGGASLLTATALRLPLWARRRREQMHEAARRVVALQESPDPPGDLRDLRLTASVGESAPGV